MSSSDIKEIVHIADVNYCLSFCPPVLRDTCLSLGTCDQRDNFVKSFRENLLNYYDKQL